MQLIRVMSRYIQGSSVCLEAAMEMEMERAQGGMLAQWLALL